MTAVQQPSTWRDCCLDDVVASHSCIVECVPVPSSWGTEAECKYEVFGAAAPFVDSIIDHCLLCIDNLLTCREWDEQGRSLSL